MRMRKGHACKVLSTVLAHGTYPVNASCDYCLLPAVIIFGLSLSQTCGQDTSTITCPRGHLSFLGGECVVRKENPLPSSGTGEIVKQRLPQFGLVSIRTPCGQSQSPSVHTVFGPLRCFPSGPSCRLRLRLPRPQTHGPLG